MLAKAAASRKEPCFLKRYEFFKGDRGMRRRCGEKGRKVRT
jgi:hypothetical protein